MTQALTLNGDTDGAVLEQVLVGGDLSKLTAPQRVHYYMKLCEALGLNPLSRPFEYITLQGKLTLYAKKDCTDQLRSKRHVSIGKPEIQFAEGLCVVSVVATDDAGRTDADIGAVNIDTLKGEARANAIMKSVTKAKRRVTLSICGLGMVDESEVDAIPDAQSVTIDHTTGEITEPALVSVRARYQQRMREAMVINAARLDAGLHEAIDLAGYELPADAAHEEIVIMGRKLTAAIEQATAQEPEVTVG